MPTVLDPTPENLDRAAERVADGGVIAAPSDTNMALTLDPTHDRAVERAYEIKDRPTEKPLTLFVRDPGDWRRYADHPDPDLVDELVEAFWPGPLNLVLERTDRAPHEQVCMGETVAVGCLSNPVWRDLTARLDGPVAMTSANRSGAVADDELVTVDTAVDHVGDAVDLVLRGEPQDTTRASTILDLVGEPTVLRKGDVTADDVREVAGFLPD